MYNFSNMDSLNMHDINPNAPLRLLSLDGGGVRGLSSLMVLDTLMERIAEEEKRLNRRAPNDNTPLKPCDYFDLIGGTSTGGIIAILLGRLRLDCKQCISIYRELAEEIFKNDRSIKIGSLKVPYGASRFSGVVLEKAVKSTLVKLGYSEDEVMWDDRLLEEEPQNNVQTDSIWENVPPRFTDSPLEFKTPDRWLNTYEDSSTKNRDSMSTANRSSFNYGAIDDVSHMDNKPVPSDANINGPTWRLCKRKSVHRKANQRGCRAFVVTSLKNALGLPRILSTYDPNDRDTRIWEALRATSAAPTFFEEMTFGTPKVTYLDGGVGFNNPCSEVDYAAQSIWEGRPIGAIVSVGTGLHTIPSVKKMGSWLPFGLGTDISLAAALVSMATGTQYVDNQMERKYFDTATQYYRFDVDGGLANISLEQWMREDEMTSLTQQYMRDPLQIRRSRQLGELMTKLSNLPAVFEISSDKFRVGVSGNAIRDGEFRLEELDFKTGFPLGFRPRAEDLDNIDKLRSISPSGKGGIEIDRNTGMTRKILPVASDLDNDGRREESIVTTCVRAENVCLRCLRTGIPPGRYTVKFILCFMDTEHAVPSEIVFSVGRPFDPATFNRRFVDVKITPDIVPVLLHPDAVRSRVGRHRYQEKKGKGWIEIETDVPVEVGLDGALGLMITKKWEEDCWVGGWSFGGVRLEPVFGDSN